MTIEIAGMTTRVLKQQWYKDNENTMLMYILSLTQQILRDMWAHKLRSFLALFGIVWGTLTVLLLLALGQGFYTASRRDIMQIVDGTFFVIPTVTSKSYSGFPKGQKIKIKASMVMNLPKAVPDIQLASPILTQQANLSHADQQTSAKIYGISPDFASMRKINLIKESRFVSNLDINNAEHVVILGDKLKTKLFNETPALGKTVKINNVPFIIIGVMQKSSRNIYNFYEDNAIIPYSAFITLWGNHDISFFVLHPRSVDNLESTELTMRSYFAQRLHFDKTDKVALKIFNTTKMFRFFTWFFIGIQIFLGLCGALTLGVGSLSVANILFLIVTERTKEIGLRKAVGAQTWHILLQILLEALIIVGLGGFIGFVIAYSVTIVMHFIKLPNWMGVPSISMTATWVTITILAILGLLSGFFPARRAAKMDPVDALNFK